jgi:hypothetical protein
MSDLPISVWLIEWAGALGIPAATGFALYRGALAAGMTRRAATTVGATVGAVLFAWVAASALLAAAGVYEPGPVSGGSLVALALPGALLGMLAATRQPAVARALAAPGTAARLAYPQTFRVIGGVFLAAMALGVLPAAFALSAGLGDVAIGLAAPIVGYRLAAGGSRRLGLWFNILGIADLVNAVTLTVIAGPGAAHVLHVVPDTAAVTQLPLVLIPTTAVPLVLVLHIVSLRRLRSERSASHGGVDHELKVLVDGVSTHPLP